MLIDVSRRPVRLIYEECPSGLIIRTMCIRGKADGLLHQEKHYGSRFEAASTVEPQIRMPQGGLEYIETVLKDQSEPSAVNKFMQTWDLYNNQVSTALEASQRRSPHAAPKGDHQVEPYYIISGYKNQFTKQHSVWRLNLVFGAGPNERRILTVLDETNSAVLFTVQIPTSVQDLKVLTPLERYLRNPEGTVGLWSAVLDDDDEL